MAIVLFVAEYHWIRILAESLVDTAQLPRISCNPTVATGVLLLPVNGQTRLSLLLQLRTATSMAKEGRIFIVAVPQRIPCPDPSV